MPPSWGSTRAYEDRRANGVLSAFLFNLCLLIAPVAAAIAFMIIARDGLYDYDATSAGGRAIAARVERLNGELIQLDFDRQRQWDDLVAMELMAEDVHAARGFLLSVRGMLPARATSQLRLPRDGADADIERAALALLTPGTRARYQAIVPLLSRRAATAAVDPGRSAAPPADPRDFELMARALLQQPETNTLQFVLTGLRLGLAGPLPDRAAKGAAALLEASRRDDYSLGLETDMADMLSAVAPVAAFQTAAAQTRGDAGAFDNAASGQRVTTTDGGGSFLVNYGFGSPFDDNQVILSAFLPSVSGDFDLDGDVDGRDFLAWQRGESPNGTPGGPVSAGDLTDWQANYGFPPLTAASTAVPEPMGLVLGLMGLVILCRPISRHDFR
mgnify:CR=1 FL=1